MKTSVVFGFCLACFTVSFGQQAGPKNWAQGQRTMNNFEVKTSVEFASLNSINQMLEAKTYLWLDPRDSKDKSIVIGYSVGGLFVGGLVGALVGAGMGSNKNRADSVFGVLDNAASGFQSGARGALVGGVIGAGIGLMIGESVFNKKKENADPNIALFLKL